jgi:hypothetical protein
LALAVIVDGPAGAMAQPAPHEVWTAGVACGGLAPARDAALGDAADVVSAWTPFEPGLVLGADGTARHWWCGGPQVTQLTEVAGISSITAVGPDPGQQFVAVRADGTVWTWSSLGGAPAPVGGLPAARAVSGHLVLTRAGHVWTWRPAGTPHEVQGLADIVAVSAGGPDDGLALDGHGTVWTWGGAAGSIPVVVDGLGDVVAIAAGYPFGMALQRDGTVWRWGMLTFWRFCDADAPRPERLTTGAVAIGAGVRNGFVMKADGTVWAWGHNAAGVLGNGSQVSQCGLTRTRLFGAVAATASWSASALIVPVPRLASIVFPRSRVTGCRAATGIVVLAGHVPAGHLRVRLGSDGPHARVPEEITLRAGQRTKTFAIESDAVAADEVLTVTAVSDDEERGLSDTASAGVTLAPMGVSRVWLTPNPVPGGAPVSMAIVLPCAAGPGEVVVDLASSNPAVAAPPAASIAIPRGAQAVLLPVATRTVQTRTTVRLRAGAAGTVKGDRLVLTPP